MPCSRSRFHLALGLAGALGCAPNAAGPATAGSDVMPRPALRSRVPDVRGYLVPRAATPVTVDGRLDDPVWQRAEWTEAFTDIEGSVRPRPRYRTRVKMVYDDSCWYIAADLEEPDLWATITQRDAVIFRDNDFEVFVDPDGDTQRYAELELNALGTAWDLLLDKPYRDGGKPDNGWNIAGLRIAVSVNGTLNQPGDRDRGWTVEIAIPWASMQATGWSGAAPAEGTQWRVNFSRVEWDTRTVNGQYAKITDPATGKPRPEHNWVWSPQGAVNMHMPEMWGVVQFGGDHLVEHRAADGARWALRQLYYAEREYRRIHGSYAQHLEQLSLTGLARHISLTATSSGWTALLGSDWRANSDGLIRSIPRD